MRVHLVHVHPEPRSFVAVFSPHQVIRAKCQCMAGLRRLGLVIQVQR
jgi:hypothetical protein